MAIAKYVQEGNDLDYMPGADAPAGTVVVQGSLVGVASDDLVTGRLGAIRVEGVFAMPKDGAAYSAGDKVDWDGSTIIATVGSPIGLVTQDAAAGDSVAWVKLTPGTA